MLATLQTSELFLHARPQIATALKPEHLLNVGALTIRLGFWGFLIIIFVYYTPNPILIIKAPVLPISPANMEVCESVIETCPLQTLCHLAIMHTGLF